MMKENKKNVGNVDTTRTRLTRKSQSQTKMRMYQVEMQGAWEAKMKLEKVLRRHLKFQWSLGNEEIGSFQWLLKKYLRTFIKYK